MPKTDDLDLQKIRTYTLFQDLTESEIQEFIKSTVLKDYAAVHGIILREGEPGSGLAIIIRGKVRIYKKDPKGQEHLLGVLKEGDFFGEMSLLEEQVRSANVVALEDTTILWMGKDSFQALANSYSPLIAKILVRMLGDLSHRLRLTDERYVIVKSYVHSRSVF